MFYFALPNDLLTIFPTALLNFRSALRSNELPFPPAVDGTHVWVASGAPVWLMLVVSVVHYFVEWYLRIRLVLNLRAALKTFEDDPDCASTCVACCRRAARSDRDDRPDRYGLVDSDGADEAGALELV